MPTTFSNLKHSEIPDDQVLTLQLTVRSDDWRPVFIAGNFNDWRVGDERYRMIKTGQHQYSFTFPSSVKLPDTLEYRYFKGGFENAELNDDGLLAPNRLIKEKTGTKTDTVPGWSSYGLLFNPAHRHKVEILVESFDIPQLSRSRRIWSVLPHDYHESDKHYPVLYLHDAQNLIGDGAGFGSWRIEDKLAKLAVTGKHEIIIIAIEHGEKERINEFLPVATAKFGKGNGRQYVRFLSDTLKPYVDANLRTLPERIHTGIGGSSLGGLISIYAGLMAPDTFGRFMIFSPSLWITQHVPFNTIKFFNTGPTRIYIYGGGKEGSNMVANIKRFQQSFEQKGLDASKVVFQLSIDPEGQHQESRWGEEFPRALEWLFFE